MKSYLDAMRRYFDFSGRSTRSQFWLFSLITCIVLLIGIALDAAIGSSTGGGAGVVTGLIAIVHIIPSLAITVRRLHDIDRSGWWYFIQVVPLVGQIVMLVFLCTGSTPGPNRYGPAVGSRNAVSPASGAASPDSEAVNIDQLEKLAGLKANGAIDEAEYQRMKAKLMGGSNA